MDRLTQSEINKSIDHLVNSKRILQDLDFEACDVRSHIELIEVLIDSLYTILNSN